MPDTEKPKWICKICGYEHEGDAPPDVCPICGAGPDDFEIASSEAAEETTAQPKRWICKICGYIHEGNEPPEICPVCSAGPEEFEEELQTTGSDTSQESAENKTISDVIVEALWGCGIHHVFGMVGHSNLGMAEALRKQEEKGNLQFIDIRHEGAAAFACSSYAKLTGKPAVCFTIAGPGATNLLTGLYDAKVDRAPVLALTGQVDTQVIGPGAFQEVNLSNVFQDVSRFNHVILGSSNPTELVVLAIKNAILNRDVTNLIVPNEVQNLPARSETSPASLRGRLPALEISPPQSALQASLEAIESSQRPIVIAGHGARTHIHSIIGLAEKISAPILTTFKGKGLVADSHPLGCGVLGRSGTPIAQWFMKEADLLIVIGATFSKHTGITSDKKTIQIDYDPMALGKFHPIEIPVYGEIGTTLNQLNEKISARPVNEAILSEIAEKRREWRAEKQKRMNEPDDEGLNSAFIFDSLTKVVEEDAIITVDVGNNAYSFGRYFESSGKQSVIMSGYLGSIGFGYPAAIGAWAASEGGRPVWCVTGDGGFSQYMAELLTAVKYNMNITHLLLHNDQLGKIAVEQQAEKFPIWKVDQVNPDFSQYAAICGAKGIRVTKRNELEKSLKEARDYKGPSLVEVISNPKLT